MFPFAGAGLLFLSLSFRSEVPRIIAGVNDFLGIYVGTRLLGSPEQFNVDAHIREQARATKWSAPSLLFIRLPAFAAFLRPLGKVKYLQAYAVWQALSVLAFAAFLMVWPAPNRALLLCAACWSYALFADFANGQDVAVLLLVLAIVWRLAQSRPLLAGVVLAFAALLKFHLFLLVPVLLIAQRRWRMFVGASMTSAVILAVCFAVAGPNWLPEYTRFVLQQRTNPNVWAMPNLHGLLNGLPYSLALEVTAAVLIALATAWIAQRTNFSIGLSAALVGSLLTSHHAYPADMLILLPALLTLAAEIPRVPVRLLCLLLLSPLPFLIMPRVPFAGPLPLLLVALLVAVIVSVASLKIRAAAGNTGLAGL